MDAIPRSDFEQHFKEVGLGESSHVTVEVGPTDKPAVSTVSGYKARLDPKGDDQATIDLKSGDGQVSATITFPLGAEVEYSETNDHEVQYVLDDGETKTLIYVDQGKHL